jgi:O-antigen ligase
MFGKILIYAIVAVLTVLVINPPYFTYVYLLTRPLLQPFATQNMMVFGVPLTGLMSLQLVGFSILWGVVRKDFSFRVPNILPLYLLLFFALLSFANTLDLYASVVGFAKLVTAVMSYVLVYNVVKTEDDAKKLLWVIVIAALLPMSVGYYQFFTESGGRAPGGVMNRVNATLGVANAYGIYLALTLNAAIILLLHPRWRVNRYLLGVAVASILVSSVIALNRGTWIALSLGVAVATLFHARKIRIRWIVLAAVAMLGLFSKTIIDRFQMLEERVYDMSQDTFEGRISYWGATLDVLPEHPLIGWGVGTAGQVMQAHFGAYGVTHNDYLRLQLEVGILGLGVYLFFLIREALRIFRQRRHRELWYINYPMLIVIVYFLIISLPQNIFDHMVNFPLFLSLVALSYRLVEFQQSLIKEQELGKYDQLEQNRGTGAVEKHPILRQRPGR